MFVVDGFSCAMKISRMYAMIALILDSLQWRRTIEGTRCPDSLDCYGLSLLFSAGWKFLPQCLK
jgi:hypothetical protein